jgi:hypothetical protein
MTANAFSIQFKINVLLLNLIRKFFKNFINSKINISKHTCCEVIKKTPKKPPVNHFAAKIAWIFPKKIK